jgi:hypothetical protein
MTATRLAFALTALMLSPRAVLALDGNQILQTCENTSGYNQGFCLGYLMGVVDSLVNGAAPVMCTNDFVTLGQMRDIVLKFLSDHPESRHCGAIDITYVSLRNLGFMASAKIKPCVKKSNAASQKIIRAPAGTAEAGRRLGRATASMFRAPPAECQISSQVLCGYNAAFRARKKVRHD